MAKPTLRKAQQDGETAAVSACGSLGGFDGARSYRGMRKGDIYVPNSFPRYVATPLAGLLNVKEKVRLKATPNAVLEKFYAATSKHPKQVRGPQRCLGG